MLSPYIFVVIYLVVDIIYVVLSKSAYEAVVKNISGKEFAGDKKGFIVSALFSYVCMAVAWLFLVVPAVYYMIGRGMAKWKAGLIGGVVYGLALYGVFNGTLYTMFEGWDIKIFMRDMAWGVSWATILTVAFAMTR